MGLTARTAVTDCSRRHLLPSFSLLSSFESFELLYLHNEAALFSNISELKSVLC